MVATSNTIEGELVRDQVASMNKERGTLYTPWMVPWKVGRERGRASSIVQLMGERLADIGVTIDGDEPRWGAEGLLPEGRERWDLGLEMIDPGRTQNPCTEEGLGWVGLGITIMKCCGARPQYSPGPLPQM